MIKNSKILFFITIVTSLFLINCKGFKKKDNTTKDNVETITKLGSITHISNTDFKAKILEDNIQLIDVRTPKEYKDGHLENADLINYKNNNFVKNALIKLDKSKPIYVYCHSGGRSARASDLLKKEGFTVYNMKGGISGWKESGFKTVVTEENEGNIKSEDKTENNTAKKDKVESTITKEEVVNKVTQETEVVKETASEVKETIKNTTAKKLAIIKEEVVKPVKTIAPKVEQNKPLTPAIIKTNTQDFKAKIDGKNVQLIDVRTPNEYKNSHISNAKNINIFDNDFILQTSILDKSKPVYVYCRSGGRSMKAANKLKDAGFKVYNLNGGIKGWQKAGNKTE